MPVGKVDEVSVLNVCDLAPTFLRLAGGVMPEPYQSDGLDVSDALLGRPFHRTKPMMWHHPTRYKTLHALAIRDSPWKLLMDPDGSKLELYDVESDAGEQRNLAEANPPIVARLKAALNDWVDSLPKPLPPLSTLAEPAARIEAGRNAK